MEKDKHTTDIIFRVDTTKEFKGEVFALFPHEVVTYEGAVGFYTHVGQHGSADYNHCIQKSRKATELEYSDLKAEMENLGYNIQVLQKRTYKKYLADYKRVNNRK